MTDADDVRTNSVRIEVLRVPTPLPGPCVVRLTHLPTGIVVTSDEHPSSLKAKAQAIEMLRDALRHPDAAATAGQNSRETPARSDGGDGDG